MSNQTEDMFPIYMLRVAYAVVLLLFMFLVGPGLISTPSDFSVAVGTFGGIVAVVGAAALLATPVLDTWHRRVVAFFTN